MHLISGMKPFPKVEQPAILRVPSIGISKWIGFSRSASSLGSAEAFRFYGVSYGNTFH